MQTRREAHIHLNQADRIIICGLPKTGKTTLAKYLGFYFKSLPDVGLIIIDPINQYGSFDAVLPEGNRIIPNPGEEISTFDAVCRRLCTVRNHVLMLEECEDYLGQGLQLPPNAFRVIRQGRNWGIGVIAITQRLPEVSKRFFDRCQHIFFFRCGVYSQDYIRDRIGKEKASKVFQLSIENHEFAHYDVGADTIEIYRLRMMGEAKHLEPVREDRRTETIKASENIKEREEDGQTRGI